MKVLLLLTALTLTASFCSNLHKDKDNFEFGTSYNSIRLKYGSPLIKTNMTVNNCCGVWTTYEIGQIQNDNKPYHSSKTISAITNSKLTEEKDIYRRNIDDTTLMQINILSHWIWNENRIEFKSNMGKIDKRILNIKAKDYIPEHSKYPDYHWTDLNLTEADSVLKIWGLCRSDNY